MRLKPRLKQAIAVTALLVTIVAFAWYLQGHPNIVKQLGRTDPWLLAGLVAGYGLFTVALAGVQFATL